MVEILLTKHGCYYGQFDMSESVRPYQFDM